MKIELTFTGNDLDSQHNGDWDFTFVRDGIPICGGGADTLGEALTLAIAAAKASGIDLGNGAKR